MVPVQDDLVRQAKLPRTRTRSRTQDRCTGYRPVLVGWARATATHRNPDELRLQTRGLAGLSRPAQHLGCNDRVVTQSKWTVRRSATWSSLSRDCTTRRRLKSISCGGRVFEQLPGRIRQRRSAFDPGRYGRRRRSTHPRRFAVGAPRRLANAAAGDARPGVRPRLPGHLQRAVCAGDRPAR
jgi:hypothetical protein